MSTQKAAQTSQLSSQYIQDHMHAVHTPESWARAVIEAALNTASQGLGGNSKDSAEVDMKMKISAYQPQGCIRMCVNVGGVEICTHIG